MRYESARRNSARSSYNLLVDELKAAERPFWRVALTALAS